MDQRLINILKTRCEKAKVCIWGLGKEGMSTYRLLRALFPTKLIYVADEKPVELDNTIQIPLLELKTCDIVFKSPGIPVLDDDIATDNITSQSDLFLQVYGRQTIAITGTKGKSTTASLLAHQLACNGFDTLLVGNIGTPCFDVIDKITPKTFIVFEISAHQLQFVHDSAIIGVCLNIYEEHLDHYHNFDEYAKCKSNVVKYQHDNDLAIVNKQCLSWFDHPKHCLVSSMDDTTSDIYVREDGFIHTPYGNLYVTDTPLKGIHNLYNTAIVYTIASHAFNIHDADFLYALKSFKPLPHRLEYVGTYNGISYYDDSISTVPQTTIAALKALPKVNILLVGGMDRGVDYTPLEKVLETADLKRVYLMYGAGKRIAKELGNCKAEIIVMDDLASVMDHVKRYGIVGDTVLLSPAASSYDAFKNFEARGDYFAALARHE